MHASGNDPNGYTTSPGKGWNVITVGGSDDRGTSVWSDDVMWSDSTAESSDNYATDHLDTDLDLHVEYFDGVNWVLAPDGYSASFHNSYELVDFIAPYSGDYRIRVTKVATEARDVGNQLGIAWVKDAVYLPRFLSNYDGWDSEIWIRNDGAEPQTTRLTIFDSGGSFVAEENVGIPSNGRSLRNPGLNDFIGSAIVNGGENLSVVVSQIHGDQKGAYTGLRSPGAADPGWESISSNVHLTHVYRDYYGYTTDITIFNPNMDTNEVHVDYCWGDGSGAGSDYRLIGPLQTIVIQPPTSNFQGSAQIWSDNGLPLAVVADALHISGERNFNYTALNDTIPGDEKTYWLPYLMNNYSGWTLLRRQELGPHFVNHYKHRLLLALG